MTSEQKSALYMLLVSLKKATETALFDELATEMHPDVINEFCNGVACYAREYFPTGLDDKSNDSTVSG